MLTYSKNVDAIHSLTQVSISFIWMWTNRKFIRIRQIQILTFLSVEYQIQIRIVNIQQHNSYDLSNAQMQQIDVNCRCSVLCYSRVPAAYRTPEMTGLCRQNRTASHP